MVISCSDNDVDMSELSAAILALKARNRILNIVEILGRLDIFIFCNANKIKVRIGMGPEIPEPISPTPSINFLKFINKQVNECLICFYVGFRILFVWLHIKLAHT